MPQPTLIPLAAGCAVPRREFSPCLQRCTTVPSLPPLDPVQNHPDLLHTVGSVVSIGLRHERRAFTHANFFVPPALKKILAAFTVVLYLTPPLGLLLGGIAAGDLRSVISIVGTALRLLAAGFLAYAIGPILVERLGILEHEGWRYHTRFFPIYAVLFVLFSMLLGAELRYGDLREPVYRP